MGEKAVDIIINKQFVTEALIDNLEKALGRKPVKIGKEGEERAVFVYRGDVANRAIQLAGFELSMFKEKQEIKHSFEFEKMSDAELVQELEREARLLLENHSEDGNGDSGA